MKRRTYLSVAAAGLAGCLDHDRIGRADDRVDGATNTSSTIQSTDDPGESDTPGEGNEDGDPRDDGRSLVHGDPFDDFDDLSPWTVLDGSLDDAPRGARLDADTTDERVWIRRTLSEPLDCSNVVPGLILSTGDSVVPRIQLFDGDENRADFRRGINGDRRPLRYSFGLETVTGSVDLSDVAEIRIALWVGDRARTMHVDELFFVPRRSTGTVTIQFDDGYATDYTEAVPILDRYGYVATSFVNPTTIGGDGRLGLERCSRLADAGWTIGSHRYSHRRLKDLSADEQVTEIADAHQWLVDHGFEDGARYFAYPFGEWTDRTLDIVDEYHDLAFWSGRGVGGAPVEPLLCPRVGEPSAETAVDLLDRAARWGGHVGLFYHELTDQQRTDFERTIEHLHRLESAGRIDVVTPADLAERVLQ
ncbi:polysaccharide deacetylase family protein [Halovivax cerinus]|uniref:Polysaccharide deacetylase family protein n=1 Tax=Halovivax cerinus TaxID=1487865 RepID=A0ABD5NT45_9EURY|nr:polysaccharide deacetylase family protein [Halovivax cerinus]